MEKEYTVIALLRILKKRVLLIVCASVVLGIVSFFCMSRWNDTHNQYVATTYFAVAHADKKNNDPIKYQTQMYAQQYNVSLLKTITKLVTTPKVIGDAVKVVEKGNNYSSNQLYGVVSANQSKKIGVGNDKDTMIVTITYKGDTPKYAASMSNELFNQTRLESKKIWGTNNLKLINKAIEPTHKSQVSSLKIALITFGGPFILLSIIYIFKKVMTKSDFE